MNGPEQLAVWKITNCLLGLAIENRALWLLRTYGPQHEPLTQINHARQEYADLAKKIEGPSMPNLATLLEVVDELTRRQTRNSEPLLNEPGQPLSR